MNTQPLDELYFVWLYSQVADPSVTNSSLTYWNLLKELFTTEFVWLIPNDDNRAEDGKALRAEFVLEKDLVDVAFEWVELGCSVLELMVGLSRRLSFEAEGESHFWFWQLLENLGIDRICDTARLPKDDIDQILYQVIFRDYEANGQGGFFPLKRTNEDQRRVELWYQLSAYVLEQGV